MDKITDKPLYLKNFDSSNIFQYAQKIKYLSNFELDLLNEITKGQLMFKEKFVADIRFYKDDDLIFHIESKVKAEMKKCVTYKVCAKISDSCEVQECSCGCPAGKAPASCKHSFGLLYCLEDYSRRKMYLAPTEKLQEWHRPKVIKFSPKKSYKLFGRKTPKKILTGKPNYSALMSGDMNLQIFSYLDCTQQLMEAATPPIPACVLSRRPASIFPEEINFNVTLFLVSNLKFDLQEMRSLEISTTSQSGSELWRKERIIRLTASSFFDVCQRTGRQDSLAEEIFNNHFKDLSRIPAGFLAYGKEMEHYVWNIIRQRYSKFIVRKVGLVTNPFFPYLSASPDEIIHNGEEDTYLLEIKCCYNIANKDLEEIANQSGFCLSKQDDGQWRLKRSHRYFYQVQGQLAVSNFKKCVFAFFYKRPNYVHVEEVTFDITFWKSMCDKLYDFYINFYLPLLFQRFQ